MILKLKAKISKKESDLFLNTSFLSFKIDYIIGNNEIDVEQEYYVFLNIKLDNKNKINFELILSIDYELLKYFIFINSVDLIGSKTTQKIFNIGIEEFKINVQEQNRFILKNKYKLSEKQIENLFKKNKTNNNEISINQNLIDVQKQLILLGYKKQIVNKILNNNYQELNILSNDEIIKFMIKELSYYEFEKK